MAENSKGKVGRRGEGHVSYTVPRSFRLAVSSNNSFALALALPLTRQDLARLCGDVPNGLNDAHHSRILQSEREYVLPYALIVGRVPVEHLPPSSGSSAAALSIAGIVFAFTLRRHCLGHRGGRGELLRDGEREECCCERGGVVAHAESVE
jgi:hypothetical protein